MESALNEPKELINLKNKIANNRIGLVLIQLLLLILQLLILLWQMQINRELNFANEAVSQTQNMLSNVESKSVIKDTQINLADAVTAIQNVETSTGRIFAVYSLVFILIFIVLFSFIISITFHARYEKRKEAIYKDQVQKAYDRGYSDGVKKTILIMNEDISLLRNISIWLYTYSQSRAEQKRNEGFNKLDDAVNKVNLAANLFRQFMNRMETRLGLQQVGEINTQVSFDFAHHRTLEKGLNPGENVTILEPGWSLIGEIISKPLVGSGNGN